MAAMEQAAVEGEPPCTPSSATAATGRVLGELLQLSPSRVQPQASHADGEAASEEQLSALAAQLQQVQGGDAPPSGQSGDAGAAAAAALVELVRLSQGFNRDHASILRTVGTVPALVKLMERSNPMQSRIAASQLAAKLAELDLPTAELLIRAGFVKALCMDCLDAAHRDLAASALHVMLVCCRGLTPGSRTTAFDNMFRLGGATKICNLLDTRGLTEVCGRLMGWITAIPSCRERMLDLGLIPAVVAALRANPDSRFYATSVSNFALSDSLVVCLKDCDVLGVLQEILSQTSVSEVVRTIAICTLALTYGSDDSNPAAARLLSAHDISRNIMHALDACINGDGKYAGLIWNLQDTLKMVQSLSAKEQHASRLVRAGVVNVLVELMGGGLDSQSSQDYCEWPKAQVQLPTRNVSGTGAAPAAAPPAPFACVPRSSGLGSAVDTEAVLLCCRALARMATIVTIRKMLIDAGVVLACSKYRDHGDLRVADAAQSCLLLLDQLDNEQAKQAVEGMAQAHDESEKYDVFLSHKRTDAKDFARALYNLLVLRGIKTFLDYEYRDELESLGDVVSNSTNFVFILTDNIFESGWCMRELESAIDHDRNIILVTKEGSRWKDANGNPCPFPPKDLIDTLPEKVRPVLTRKAIAHSDEYYQAFVDNLMKKVKTAEQPAPAPAAAAAAVAVTGAPSALPGPMGGPVGGLGQYAPFAPPGPQPEVLPPPAASNRLGPLPEASVRQAATDTSAARVSDAPAAVGYWPNPSQSMMGPWGQLGPLPAHAWGMGGMPGGAAAAGAFPGMLGGGAMLQGMAQQATSMALEAQAQMINTIHQQLKMLGMQGSSLSGGSSMSPEVQRELQDIKQRVVGVEQACQRMQHTMEMVLVLLQQQQQSQQLPLMLQRRADTLRQVSDPSSYPQAIGSQPQYGVLSAPLLVPTPGRLSNHGAGQGRPALAGLAMAGVESVGASSDPSISAVAERPLRAEAAGRGMQLQQRGRNAGK